MPKIYLINVGANSNHARSAKSPIFADGSFVYVSFPLPPGVEGKYSYNSEAWAFTNGLTWHQTHNDPDWEHLTYGDRLSNPRAAALSRVDPGDILLFWALLWRNDGDCWIDFTNDKAWYLIGAIRVDEVLKAGQSFTDAKPKNRSKAKFNEHFWDDHLSLEHKDYVFIGDPEHSTLFDLAVPLIDGQLSSSLLYRCYRTKSGDKLPLNGVHWSSFTRSCRAVWNLENVTDRKLAKRLQESIIKLNDYDLLAGIDVG